MKEYTKEQIEILADMDKGFACALRRAMGYPYEADSQWCQHMTDECYGYISAYMWVGAITCDQFADISILGAFRQ